MTQMVSAGSLGAVAMALAFSSLAFGKVDFNREVRPILSENCFSCHGLDEQKSGLRLDFAPFARKGGDSGNPAVSPGKPEVSELLKRVTDHGDDRMPPKGERLTEAQVDVLTRWIAQGGEYARHWAYVKPVAAEPPEVKNEGLVRNPVDRFVLARLEKEGLGFSKPADKATWLRRVSLDLVGLPPSLEEVDAFLADDSAGAREKVVDRLLASPRYGEHWARQWLDLARYADSNGFQADQLRDSWAFRDWVIEAMNADLPFDRFTVEQIAGDLLPAATAAQRVATGFHRTPTCNVEAGVHPEENRVNQVVDRVNTTGLVWLGTTLECAQCHSHKYDPFSQEEYYRLFAFFNNTPVEVKGKGGVSFDFWGPTMDLPLSDEQRARKQQAERKLAEAERKLAEAKKAAETGFDSWLAEQRAAHAPKANAANPPSAPAWSVLKPLAHKSTGGETFRALPDHSLLAGGPTGDKSVYEIETAAPAGKLASLRFETLTHDELPRKGPGRCTTGNGPNFVLTELTVSLLHPDGKLVPLKLARAWADFSQGNFSAAGLIDGKRDARNGWAIAPEFSKPRLATFDLAAPLDPPPGSRLRFKLEHLYGGGRNVGRPRFSASPVPTGKQDKSARRLPASLLALLKKEKNSAKEREKLRRHFLKDHASTQTLEKEVAAAKKALGEVKGYSTLVMVEMDETRETRVMNRGNYLDVLQKVSTGTPDALHAWKKEWPRNRLGLARWLVDRDNPLAARVAVNRWWGQFFGRGIVSTEEDFGSQSEPPTHPALLDWLAVRFMEDGWSMKKVHRLLALSATYGQSSRLTPELLERDPGNLLYARGPRFRLTAEMIRDNALRISGLLSAKMGGPPVYPPQPAGLWRQVGRNEPTYATSSGEDRFRRGVYVIWRRASPYPGFVNFDGPDRSACHPKRSRTNTPLQALTLLNDQAYVEMALAFALRVLEERPAADLDERLRHAFRLALAREPKPAEVAVLRKLHQGERNRLAASPAPAKALLAGIPAVKVSPRHDVTEVAAWFFLANTLLNLDETVTKG